MRILAAIVVPPHLSASGAVRAGRRLSEALGASCEMHIASMSPVDCRPESLARELPVRCHLPLPLRALPPRYRTLFYASDIPSLVTRGDYDLVHLHNPMPALELERIAAACRRRGVPYVISTHGFNEVANAEALHGFGPAQTAVWRLCMRRPLQRVLAGAAGVFALSPADQPIVRAFGFGGSTTIVPNGVELPPMGSPEADAAALRRLGIPDRADTPAIACLFLGNHTPNKGVPVLLEAFRRVQAPYLLMVVGDRRGDIDYGFGAASRRPDQQVFVTGRLSEVEVGALFRRCDLFVFPTRADTFPLVVLEAMAHGRPVLSTEVGGIPYQVGPGCGVLVPPGDPQAVADAIERLAADPRALVSMGVQGASRVRDAFTWEAAARRALDGYREILSAAALRSCVPARIHAHAPLGEEHG